MKSKLMKQVVLFSAVSVLLAGAAQAALRDRDLDKNGVTDAFYDTDLDITWLRDANVNGPMTWDVAVRWADGYSFGGASGWRLANTDASCLPYYPCAGSEIGHLWTVELGNWAGTKNTGDFQNLQSQSVWFGAQSASNAGEAWVFDALYGYPYIVDKTEALHALAVHPGDVAGVPEPGTLVLMLAGLAALGQARRQRPG